MPDDNKDVLTDEPLVMQEVLKEIKTMGAESKENYAALRNENETLQEALKKQKTDSDVLLTEKIEKVSEAVSVRQDEMDKATASRIDNIEVALKRPVKGIADHAGEVAQESKAAHDFKTACLAFHGKLPEGGVSEKDVDVDGYEDYKKAFNKFLRKENTHQGMIHLSSGEAKALSVGSDSDGGFLVTPEISSRVIQRVFETDPLRGLAGNITISTDSIEMLVDFDDLDASWVGENDSRSESSTPEWSKKKIFAHELSASPKATQKLLEDSAVNVETWLSGKLGSKFGRTEAAAFVNGDGVARPRGFLSYSTTSAANTVEIGAVEQIAMGAAAALTTDGFTNVMYGLEEEFMFRGTWLMNRLAVRDTMKLKDGDGNYIWRVGLEPGQPSSILGMPVRMSTTMPIVAANSLSVAFADWSRTYLIVDRIGMSVLRDPYTDKPHVIFYTRKRVGGDVVDFQSIKIGKVSA